MSRRWFRRAGRAGLGGASQFSPLSLGWEVYCDHTSLVDTAGEVRTWTDLSGNGYDLTEVTSPPSFTASDAAFNGLPSVTFDGTNGILRGGSLALGGACTFVMVATGITGATPYYYCRYGTSVLDVLYGGTNYSTEIRRNSGADLSYWNAGAGWGNFGSTPKVLVVVCDGTHAGHRLMVNDVSTATTDTALTGNPAASDAGTLYVGAHAVSGYGAFTAAFFAIRNGALSAEEITALTNYLRGVYGI